LVPREGEIRAGRPGGNAPLVFRGGKKTHFRPGTGAPGEAKRLVFPPPLFFCFGFFAGKGTFGTFKGPQKKGGGVGAGGRVGKFFSATQLFF